MKHLALIAFGIVILAVSCGGRILVPVCPEGRTYCERFDVCCPPDSDCAPSLELCGAKCCYPPSHRDPPGEWSDPGQQEFTGQPNAPDWSGASGASGGVKQR